MNYCLAAAAALLMLVPSASAQEAEVGFRSETGFGLDAQLLAEIEAEAQARAAADAALGLDAALQAVLDARVEVLLCTQASVALDTTGLLEVGLHEEAQAIAAVVVDGKVFVNPFASCEPDESGSEENGSEENSWNSDAEKGGSDESRSEGSDNSSDSDSEKNGSDAASEEEDPLVEFSAEGDAVTFVSVEGLEQVVVVLCTDERVELEAAGLVEGMVHQETGFIAQVLLITESGTQTVAGPVSCEQEDCTGPQGVEARSHEEAMKVSWEALAGAEAYRVHRAEGAGEMELLATVDAGETLFVDEDIEAGTTYTYSVTAILPDGETEACALVEVTAIPVFPSIAVAAIGTLGAVGAYAVGRRRS